jgi:hypothetical protein
MTEIRDGQAILVGPKGDLVQVPADQAAARIASGIFAPASAEMVADADSRAQATAQAQAEQARLSSVGSVANTALQSAAQAITAPIDWTANKLGAQGKIINVGQTAEEAAGTNTEIKKMQSANPIAAGVGEIGGQLVGAAATGLGSGAANVAGRLATSGLARTAIGAGIEGLALGAAQQMEDVESSAQQVLFAGGMGALLGAGGGAALHGLGRVFGKSGDTLGAKAFADAQQSVERDAAIAKGPAYLDAKMAKASGADLSLVEEFGARNMARREAAIDASAHFDEFAQKTAYEMSDTGSRLMSSAGELAQEVRNRGQKQSGMAKLIGPELEEDVVRNRAAVGIVNGAVDEYATLMRQNMLPERIPQSLRNQITLMDRTLNDAISAIDKAGTLSEKNIIADSLKRHLDQTVESLRKSSTNPNFSDFDFKATHELADNTFKVADSLRKSLENPEIWGKKAAAAQRDVNAVWHEGAVDSWNDYGRTFERATGHTDFATGRMKFEQDLPKFEQLVKQLGTTAGEKPRQILENYVQHVGKLIEEIGNKYELSPQMVKVRESAMADMAKMRGLLDTAKEKSTLVDRWRLLSTYDRSGDKTLLGAVAKRIPFAGAPIDIINTAITNPAGDLATNALRAGAGTVARAQQATERAFMGVGNWIARGAKAAQGGRQGAISAALTAYRHGHENDDQATAKRTQALLKADPSKLGEHLPDEDPGLMLHAGTVAQNGLSYLRSKLPPYAQSPSLMRSGRAAIMSKPDQAAFARVWGTVAKPESAFSDLKSGRLLPDQVEALQTVYPKMYERLRDTALQALSRADDSGVEIPIQARQQLAMLLGSDGIADNALSGDLGEKINGMLAKAQRPGKPKPQQSSVRAQTRIIDSARSPFEASQEA